MKNHDTDFVIERKGRIQNLDRDFDIEYWQRLGPEAIFEASWRMVLHAHGIGEAEHDQFRLQRSVESFRRTRR